MYLFTILADWLGTPGGEKPFRLFVAIIEIVASVLVLIPRTQAFGALFALGIMSGAIFFHAASSAAVAWASGNLRRVATQRVGRGGVAE